MYKLMSATTAVVLPAWVSAQETAPADQPAETVDLIYVALFGLIFLGMVVGFFVNLWLNERRNKQKDGGAGKKTVVNEA